MKSLLAHLPLRWSHALGAVLAWVIFPFARRWRVRLTENLARAGYTDARVRRAAVAEAGRMMFEAPKIWLRPREEILALMRNVRGMEAAAAARAAGKGIVYLTPHYGCFEVAVHIVAEHGPITALYRAAHDEELRDLMQMGRERHNVKLASSTLGGVRQLLAALKRGEAVGILPDQVPGVGEGEWTEFFGRPAYTMTLAGRLCERADVAPFLVMCTRLAHGEGYDMHVQPLTPAHPGESGARRVNRALEEAIRAHRPEQYMWSYNRYKHPAGAPLPPP
ncbi:MAG: lysophospholipid acyltransferase family protein [Burkholderiales bacterium]